VWVCSPMHEYTSKQSMSTLDFDCHQIKVDLEGSRTEEREKSGMSQPLSGNWGWGQPLAGNRTWVSPFPDSGHPLSGDRARVISFPEIGHESSPVRKSGKGRPLPGNRAWVTPFREIGHGSPPYRRSGMGHPLSGNRAWGPPHDGHPQRCWAARSAVVGRSCASETPRWWAAS
jgi:hypothetical protein